MSDSRSRLSDSRAGKRDASPGTVNDDRAATNDDRAANNAGGDGGLALHFGHDELVIRQRYEVLSIVNDILIGIWFVIGSIFFFYESLAYAGTWLFVIGSVEMLIRPVIRLVRRLHLQRLNGNSSSPSAAEHDF